MLAIALISVIVLIGADQAIKYWALQTLVKVETMPLMQDVLHLTYVENRGAAFSILQDKKWFLIVVTSLISIAVLGLLLSGKLRNRIEVCSVVLILAGGVGNLIDRMMRGFVVDYIDFRLIHFPVFNFADCCVVVGTILFAVYILFLEGKLPLKEKTGESDGEKQGE